MVRVKGIEKQGDKTMNSPWDSTRRRETRSENGRRTMQGKHAFATVDDGKSQKDKLTSSSGYNLPDRIEPGQTFLVWWSEQTWTKL